MEVNKTDLLRAETVLKSLRRGKYELEGDEVLAFAQAFSWIAELLQRMKFSLETPPPAQPAPEPPKEEKKIKRKVK